MSTVDAAELSAAVKAAERYLAGLQHGDGHWCAELEGDTILESEYALMLYFLGRAESGKFQRLANYLRSQRLANGAWGNFPGGPPDASVSVKAYLVLRLAGDDPQDPHMREARRVIRELGGLDACNSYTRLLLCIFGAYEWDRAPAVPPEIVLLPRWFYFNIYAMSSWSRAIVVPLSVIWAHKPSCEVPPDCRLEELRIESPAVPASCQTTALRDRFWSAVFRGIDIAFKEIEDFGLLPLRRRALVVAEEWVESRLRRSAGLGAIFPSIMNTVLAFVCQGRGLDDAAVRGQLHELEKLEIADGDELRLQPCCSPVWDTALAVNALLDAGRSRSAPEIQAAARWLLDKEVREIGDWEVQLPGVAPGGWYFEYANEFYPDCDDTAEVMAVLQRVRFDDPAEEERRRAALDRALAWQMAMQSRCGGWGAFDKDCDRRVLELVPFADHNAMLDPATVDVTGRTLEALVDLGIAPSDSAVRRGVAFIYAEQEPEGCWYGRWGANYIYGTWLALTGLRHVGENMRDERVQRGSRWLQSCQNADGGWGESLRSYAEPSLKGIGPSTASQTAWALLGLMAAGALDDESGASAVERGVRYLLETQRSDGSWYDEHWTGTGFPGVFYLRYHLYASYFPLQALATFRRILELKCGAEQAA